MVNSMETLNFGWGFPIVGALAALILFFAGCLFVFGLYCTYISLSGKFPARAVILFWLLVITSALMIRVGGMQFGVALYVSSSPIMAFVFWYYERKHRRMTGESEIIVMA